MSTLPDRPPRPADDLLTRRALLEQGLRLSAGLVLATPMRRATSSDDLTLSNDDVAATWTVADGHLRAVRVTDRRGTGSGASLTLGPTPFSLLLDDGSTIAADAMRIVSGPTMERIAARATASRLAERVPGRQATVVLEDAGGRVRATWRAILRDGSHYVRQEVTLQALGEPRAIRSIVLVDTAVPNGEVVGTVKGSPIVSERWFLGFEHPLADNALDGGRARGSLARVLPLRPDAPVTVSSVIGVARPTQRRRDFLAYVERERAHPYRTFLHYNSWYDIGYFSKYSEAEAVAVIETYGRELVRQRGVVLDSFLFDDGWDDPQTLWGFHKGFPDGFSRVHAAAKALGAAPGVWLSPWGGYGKPKQERLTAGRAAGFESNEGGFALSGPTYYTRFHDTCLNMMRRYGVNQFKFDGTGNATRTFPGSLFDSDFDAAIHLIDDLRRERADLYVNLTTGTYPSPFWLRYADSIWRGGEDHEFAGVGTDRQRWITYRDADTYARVVKRGPLFPVSSLMLHGLVYARHANKLDIDPGNDFDAEVRSYFGTGTQLQEMYVTPVLTSTEWDTLAECARWSRRNATTLADTHWVGGDPGALEPYGWASWSTGRGILTLRNPNDRPQRFPVDVAALLELPNDAPQRLVARSPWARDRTRAPLALRAGEEHALTLAPFEVVTLQLTPQ